jgi:hypothetical protein
LETHNREVRPLFDQLADATDLLVMGTPRPSHDVIAIVEQRP